MEETNTEEEKNLSVNKKIDKILEAFEPKKKSKGDKKKMKIPRRAKVKKTRIKKGWIGVLRIDENGHISGEKQRVNNSTLRIKNNTYHATDGREILFWEGKFPVIIQPTWKANPMIIRKEKDKNETYGQQYIRARMLTDTIKVKAEAKGIMWIIGLAIAGYILYSLFKGGA